MTEKTFKEIKKEYLEEYDDVMEIIGIVIGDLYKATVTISEHDQFIKRNIRTLTYALNNIYDIFKENYVLAEEAQNANELLLAVKDLNEILITFDNLVDAVEALRAFSFSLA